MYNFSVYFHKFLSVKFFLVKLFYFIKNFLEIFFCLTKFSLEKLSESSKKILNFFSKNNKRVTKNGKKSAVGKVAGPEPLAVWRRDDTVYQQKTNGAVYASQHIVIGSGSRESISPQLSTLLPLSLAAARHPPRPPPPSLVAVVLRLLHKLREKGPSCALWFLLSVEASLQGLPVFTTIFVIGHNITPVLGLLFCGLIRAARHLLIERGFAGSC